MGNRSITEDWHDAGLQVSYAWHQLANAKTVIDQARAFARLSDAMSDLNSWLPGYDDNCTMPWERGEDS